MYIQMYFSIVLLHTNIYCFCIQFFHCVVSVYFDCVTVAAAAAAATDTDTVAAAAAAAI